MSKKDLQKSLDELLTKAEELKVQIEEIEEDVPEVDWSKVEKNTLIDMSGSPRYFSRFSEGEIYFFRDGKTSETGVEYPYGGISANCSLVEKPISIINWIEHDISKGNTKPEGEIGLAKLRDGKILEYREIYNWGDSHNESNEVIAYTLK